jgi:lysophospholipase L1-like esterase
MTKISSGVKVKSLGLARLNLALSSIEKMQHPDLLTIACVGDSITFGYGVEENLSYPIQLLGMIDSSKYQVLNYGLSGRAATKSADWPYWKEQLYLNLL